MKKNTPKFGPLLEKLRIQRDLTLREFCKRSQSDVAYISKIERGTVLPPEDPREIARYADALELKLGSKKRRDFICTAYRDRIAIPKILNNKELIDLLPIFVCTSDGKRPTDKQLKKLAQVIQKSY